jgi:predicted NAD-dependent protein-ADP-ribosyltransferase YbiA (DUF1768 family)
MKFLELKEIKKRSVYTKENAAWFLSKQDPRWELSNMAGGMTIYWPVERCEKNRWGSSEHLYQATKYGTHVLCLPESAPDTDPCVRRRIRAQRSSRGAKMTQKCAVTAGLVRPDWDDPNNEVRIQAMIWVVELKLYWNPLTFGRVLQETGTQPIVEISRKDAFWGCKVAADGTLIGVNALGKILERVRLRSAEIKAGKFSFPAGFLLP